MRRHLVFTALILALPLAFGCASKKPWSGGGMKPANNQNHRFDPRFQKHLLNGLLYPPQGNPGAGAVGIKRPGGQPAGNPNLRIPPPSGAPPKQTVASDSDKNGETDKDKEKESAKKKKEGPTDTEEVVKKSSDDDSTERKENTTPDKTLARRRSSDNATH